MGHPASADRATDNRASVAVTMRLRHGVSLGACPPARESTGDRRRGRLPHRSGVDIRAVGVVSRCRSQRPAAGCSTKRLISLGRCAAWLPAVVSRLEDTRSRARQGRVARSVEEPDGCFRRGRRVLSPSVRPACGRDHRRRRRCDTSGRATSAKCLRPRDRRGRTDGTGRTVGARAVARSCCPRYSLPGRLLHSVSRFL